MLDKKHGGLIGFQQLFYLHSGKYVDVVQRFIPNIQVRRRD